MASPRDLWLVCLLLLLIPFFGRAQYQHQDFSAGAMLIDMGVRPQTSQNTLKAYGLLYDLLQNYDVEVKWIINPEKEKDSADFTHNNRNYHGGAFIIPVSYLNKKVKQRIETWKEKGVVVDSISEDISLPVFSSLTIPPKWTLDKQNGYIAVPFFKAAGIPASAYGGARVSNWKNPDELGVCDDIFVLPHSDPKFDTHKNLYFWNKNYKGAIWAGCHAASKLENLSGNIRGENNSEETIQLNFLSLGFPGARSAGLVSYRDHRHGTPPYLNSHSSDPVAQYLGSPDKAHLNGSERIFFPKRINKWRPESKILVSDPDAPDMPEVSQGEAVISIYGHGFGDPNNGLVMYQAGHSIYGDTEDHIAAMRAFFNWSFYAAEIKRKGNLVDFSSLDGELKTVAARIGDDLTDILKLQPINFDLDKYEIREDAKPQLREIANFMLKNPEILLDIRSYTDSRANTDYNQKLSDNRVKATSEFLVENGVAISRISGRGYGETEPVNKCRNGVECSEIQHEENRRSEFILSIDCEVYNEEQNRNN